MPYMLGRLPEDTTKPRLTLAAHLRATVPPPASADWYSTVQAWGMLGNDTVGDCVFAGNGHIVEQQTALGEGDEIFVTDQEALLEYSRVTGYDPDAGPSGGNPTDRGALVQDGLADLRRNGLAGQKIAAFARVDETNVTAVKTALAELGCVDLGLNLPQSAMDQFHAGQPWTVAADDGGSLGSHCVVAFGYDAQYIYIVTWGRVVPVTWEWFARYTEEAWAVVSALWAGRNGTDPEGVNLASLGAEFAELTGEPSPFTDPVPGPAPAPGPIPAPDHAGLLREVASMLREVAAGAGRELHEVISLLNSHGF